MLPRNVLHAEMTDGWIVLVTYPSWLRSVAIGHPACGIAGHARSFVHVGHEGDCRHIPTDLVVAKSPQILRFQEQLPDFVRL